MIAPASVLDEINARLSINFGLGLGEEMRYRTRNVTL